MMNAVLRTCPTPLRDYKLSALVSAFHSSCTVNERRKYPFKVQKPLKIPSNERSGDKEGLVTIDLKQPMLKFRNSKELETADESVKKIFSLAYAPKKHTLKVLEEQYRKQVRKHKLDFLSLESQITAFTVRIRSMQAQLKVHKTSQIGITLKETIDQRVKFLNYLRKIDQERFEWLLEKLNISYIPPPKYQYTTNTRIGIRELTQKYCEQVRISRLQAYREQLKSQQADFIKEREEMLNFIAKEEKELGLTDAQPIGLESELMKKKPYPVESSMLSIARRVDNTEETVRQLAPPQHPKIDY